MNIGRGVSLFLLGIILGGALVNLFIGLQIDNLSLANQSLRNELWARESELQELTAIVDECKKQVVTGIQPHIAFPEKTANKYEEQLLKMEIENHVRELLETLKGQEVKEISYLIL
ncbi:MAG TPA: hypothetical protein VFD15_06855, partial [Clostridia bacterium]|nr:hypothetical protein [Clostridia bacterium]